MPKWSRLGLGPRVAAGIVAALVGVGLLAAPTGAHADDTRDGQWMIDALDLPDAWKTTKGKGVTVGTVDTGVDAGHPDLKGSVEPGKSFIDDSDGRSDPEGHGTSAASLVAGHGHGDDAGVMGVAPEAKILPAQLELGEDAKIAEFADAIRWLADNGADIILIEAVHVLENSDEHAAVKYAAIERGIPVVTGVGNTGTDYSGLGKPPSRTGTLYPAGYEEVIGASATNSDGKLSDLSMYGTNVTVAAPGESVTAAKPGKGYTEFGGTSAASAVTAGVLALLKAEYPDETRMELTWRLTELITDAGEQGDDDKYGFGIVDPAAALTEDPGPLPDELKDPEPTGTYPDESSKSDKDAAEETLNGSGSSALPIVVVGITVVALAVLVLLMALLLRRRRRSP
ncbi:MAG: S8 family serine peptidase [Stackebrandtia sp.]